MKRGRMDNKYIRAREIRKQKERKQTVEFVKDTIAFLGFIGICYFVMCLPSLITNA